MKNSFKIIITISSLIIAFSVAYNFVLRPIQKDKPLKDCVKRMDGGLKSEQERFEKAFRDGLIDKQKETQGLINAERAYSKLKDECYKKY